MTDPPAGPLLKTVRPPRWAEVGLHALLRRDDAETVSGDLLEEYRETIYPTRGRWRADLWFVRQVAGFAWRAGGVWGCVQGAAMVGRDGLDWFAPTNYFYTRSLITTWVAIAIFLTAGFWTAWRSRSLRLGALAGFLAGGIAAVVSVAV